MSFAGHSILLILLFQLFSCDNKQDKKPKDVSAGMIDSTKIIDSIKNSDAFKKTLKAKQIPETIIHFALPADFSIKKIDGPGFIIYYFSPADTLSKTDFSGCLYLGSDEPAVNLKKFDFSKGFFSGSDSFERNPDSDSCKPWIEFGVASDRPVEWFVYKCNDVYFLQTSTDYQKKYEWFTKIHLFGKSKSETGMNKLRDIFSTLRQE